LIWVPEKALDVNAPGTLGGVASAVVALLVFEKGPGFPAASTARTR
jgi:hypothetical protein